MDIWSKTLQAISKHLSKPAFDTWFAKPSLVEIDHDTKTITVSAPNDVTRDGWKPAMRHLLKIV
jgi:chromosomal replication initiation ATPase DnaA